MVVDIVGLGQSRVLNKVGDVMVGLMLRLSGGHVSESDDREKVLLL